MLLELQWLLCWTIKHHFLSVRRGLKRRRRVEGHVQCRRLEEEPQSHRQVRDGPYGTAGSTAQNLTACLPPRAGLMATDRGDVNHQKNEFWNQPAVL